MKTGDDILARCMTKRTILFLYQQYQYQNQNNANRQDVNESDHHKHGNPPPTGKRPPQIQLRHFCLSCFAIIHIAALKRNCKLCIFSFFWIFERIRPLYFLFLCEICQLFCRRLRFRALNFFPDNAGRCLMSALFVPKLRNFLLTSRFSSCILMFNSKMNRYDDREKVFSGRFRELPGGARQCGEDRRHWPSSISAETGGLGGNGFPHRYQRGGIRTAPLCRCRERAFDMPMRVVPRKFRLSSLLCRGDGGFFVVYNKFRIKAGGTKHEAHQDF